MTQRTVREIVSAWRAAAGPNGRSGTLEDLEAALAREPQGYRIPDGFEVPANWAEHWHSVTEHNGTRCESFITCRVADPGPYTQPTDTPVARLVNSGRAGKSPLEALYAEYARNATKHQAPAAPAAAPATLPAQPAECPCGIARVVCEYHR